MMDTCITWKHNISTQFQTSEWYELDNVLGTSSKNSFQSFVYYKNNSFEGHSTERKHVSELLQGS